MRVIPFGRLGIEILLAKAYHSISNREYVRSKRRTVFFFLIIAPLIIFFSSESYFDAYKKFKLSPRLSLKTGCFSRQKFENLQTRLVLLIACFFFFLNFISLGTFTFSLISDNLGDNFLPLSAYIKCAKFNTIC